MMTAILIDDEEDCRIALRNFITKYCPDVSILAEADSVQSAVPLINNFGPMLVFLDINMPDEDGFALFEQIGTPDFYTIFVTAYDEYALKAIKHHALDYILKPVNINELIGAVERARVLQEKNALNQQLNALLQSVKKMRLPEKVCLPLAEGYIYVPVEEIIRCEAVGNYTTFHFASRQKILVCRTLGHYETVLRSYGFVRVHSRYLVNIKHVEKYLRGRGGTIVMSDKKEVIVAQRRREDFLKLMNNSTDMENTMIVE